jgi:DNA mismatch repair protein MutS
MAEIAAAPTPMMRQYLELKERYPDTILFFRLGDFYEMFFEDAVAASKALQITLTARSKGDEKVPMCGVPYHAARGHVARLLAQGFKVAICDQVEEAGKGTLVKRDVTRVITPGTVFDDQTIEPGEAVCLAAVRLGEAGAGLALLETTTGQLRCGDLDSEARLIDELRRAGARELLFPRATSLERVQAVASGVGAPYVLRDDAEFERGEARLKRHLGVTSLDGFGVAGQPLGLGAAAAALAYLGETQRAPASHVDRISLLASDGVLLVDEATRTNLELERTLQGGKRKGTLLGQLDRTATAPGARLLAEWLRYPLAELEPITARLDAVEELFASAVARGDLAQALRPVADVERLVSRLTMRQGNARDLRALCGALLALPGLAGVLQACASPLLRQAAVGLAGLEPLAAELDAAVAEAPPPTLTEGGLIRRGHSAELDELITISEDGKGYIARLEARERERTGIGSLKVRYNKVFGYFIEVTKANLHAVPADYQRRQTTVGGERYVTEELKGFEEKVLTAEERRGGLEQRLFEALRLRVVAEGSRLRTAAQAVALADVLRALAEVAAEKGYCRPEVDRSETLELTDARHPVVEAMLPTDSGGFVPNDVAVSSSGEAASARHGSLLIITGPNMSGKSTIMRQAALCTLLAQMGSFVPARRARVGLADRIFTRVGASDDLARGRSTFMVEMTETAAILHNATRRSLVVLDEIGRGTSTFDGVSLAWAVAEHLHDKLGCRTLFATHYHELQELARERPRVKNLSISVRDVGDQVVFLRKLVAGGASRSYGIEVARLAGLPAEVLARARQVLKNLEAMELDEAGHPQLAQQRPARGRGGAPAPADQLGLFGVALDPALVALRDELQSLDMDALRPLDALNLLAGWKKRLGQK